MIDNHEVVSAILFVLYGSDAQCFVRYTAPDCLYYMQNGSELIKVRPNGRQYHRLFTLDSSLGELHWHPSSKKPHKAKCKEFVRSFETEKLFEVAKTDLLYVRSLFYCSCCANDCS